MSYTIENSKFVIFGNGYDGVRNDSGDGLNEPEIHPLSTPTFAAFDSSGEYVWISDGNYNIRKFRINPWEEISVTLPKGSLYHPTNVENNIGIISQYSGNHDITVFNLDTGEVIKTFASIGFYSFVSDCIMVDDDVYLVQKGNGKQTEAFRHIDLANEVDSYASMYGAVSGFVDDDTIYIYRAGSWWSDPTYANGYSLSYTSQWQGTYSTSADYPVNMGGLCANGYLYLPTLLDGEWQMGVYDGNSAPTFEPVPNPIRTYGKFPERATLVLSGKNAFFTAYTDGRTKGAFVTNLGLYFTDFTNKLVKVSDNLSRPLAMSDHYIVCPHGINQVIVYKV